MRTDETLIAVVKDARGWLKTWSNGFTDADAADSAGSPANPLAWQLGHIACTQDAVVRLFSDGKGEAPESLRAICGTGAPVPTEATRYPKLAELWRLLDRTLVRLVRLIEEAGEGGLDRPPREPNDYFTSLGQAAYEISLHETYHVGMVATLRKAHELPPVG